MIVSSKIGKMMYLAERPVDKLLVKKRSDIIKHFENELKLLAENHLSRSRDSVHCSVDHTELQF